jgi:lysozyme family protein
VPWYFTIHNRSDMNHQALHNGDPLSARTVQVPAGRPPKGQPPFTWEESAADALALKRLDAQTDWTLAGTLYQLECYNGWGYRRHHPHVLSPYLWSFSGHYTCGKYVADGRWSEAATSRQCGAAVLLRDWQSWARSSSRQARAGAGGARTVAPRPEVADPRRCDVEDLQRWPGTFAASTCG